MVWAEGFELKLILNQRLTNQKIAKNRILRTHK